MELHYIKTQTCPVCGSPVVKEEIDTDSCYAEKGKAKILEHVNGDRWEKRTFLCGCCLEYVPNFSRVQARTECPNSPEQKKIATQREKIRVKIENFLKRISKHVKDDDNVEPLVEQLIKNVNSWPWKE